MANKLIYLCNECGSQFPKWAGQCQGCGGWNCLVEDIIEKPSTRLNNKRFTEFVRPKAAQKLSDVKPAKTFRIPSGQSELDRVLGGGLVPGSIVLIGGDPGIGKSTLVLQSLSHISQNQSVLYVSGEESVEQIALRAERLNVSGQNIQLIADNLLERTLSACQKIKPSVLVIDSIQTFYSEAFTSAPGSVTQVRESSAAFVRLAKQTNCVVLLIGHVTKDGALAGPRILEHMVDTVLYFEGDRSSSFRLIRSIKNRFGGANEIGVFAMTDQGLKDVHNPSAMFISRQSESVSGSVVMAAMEGTRPMLVEVQALVDKSPLSNPRRLTVGLDASRLAMILAVLHRHAACLLYDQDVFVNVVGGMKIQEPAADLAIALAIISSYHNRIVPANLAVFGEIGLTGEIRPVQRGQQRIKESTKLGFDCLLIPKANQSPLNKNPAQLIVVPHIADVMPVLTDL